jgi:single-strand selective monofunctional uracil DNA glycosylase
MDLLSIADDLRWGVTRRQFQVPVTHVYNPLAYAEAVHRRYLERYGRGAREVILLGMNPGPWGMVQTGVPFGDVTMVRDWLDLEGPVGKPTPEHPKVPVRGFACDRREVSGTRLWGWARDAFQTPRRFFARFFVANYCPLAFLEETGRNRTPDRLPASEQAPLFAVCDFALRRTVEHLQPRIVVGVGAFAEYRAKTALRRFDVEIGRILHPSPASPAANRDWRSTAVAQMTALGIRF